MDQPPDLKDIKIVLEMLKIVIDLFEKAWPLLHRTLTGKSSKEPSVTIRKTKSGLTALYGGEPLETVTYDELSKKLSKADREKLHFLEGSLAAYVKQTQKIGRGIAKLSAAERKKALKELRDLTLPMRKDLLAILTLIRKSGFQLQDHYWHAYTLLEQFGKNS